MKKISYSIFGSRNPELNRYEFFFYMRGMFFNTLMNKQLLPDWTTHIEIDSGTFSDYDNFFNFLRDEYGATYNVNPTEPLCKAMLWRIKPVFDENVEYNLCRDADGLTTYREAQAIKEFINSGLTVHGITDNPAHTIPLMGGMIGMKCQPIRDKYGDWDVLVRGDLSKRGSDQTLLVRSIYPEFKKQMFAHYIHGMQPNGEAVVRTSISDIDLGIDKNLWESNLCIRFIGCPGVVEMETIRFFERRGLLDNTGEIAKKYPSIFNWTNL